MTGIAKADVFSPPTVRLVSMMDRPRDAEFAWLREHSNEYRGQWVALDGADLVGAALRLKDLLQALSPADQERDLLFHRVDVD